MPSTPSVRELKDIRRRAGFVEEPRRGKGSHSWWAHPALPGVIVNLSGQDGADAHRYHVKQVRDALRALATINEP